MCQISSHVEDREGKIPSRQRRKNHQATTFPDEEDVRLDRAPTAMGLADCITDLMASFQKLVHCCANEVPASARSNSRTMPKLQADARIAMVSTYELLSGTAYASLPSVRQSVYLNRPRKLRRPNSLCSGHHHQIIGESELAAVADLRKEHGEAEAMPAKVNPDASWRPKHTYSISCGFSLATRSRRNAGKDYLQQHAKLDGGQLGARSGGTEGRRRLHEGEADLASAYKMGAGHINQQYAAHIAANLDPCNLNYPSITVPVPVLPGSPHTRSRYLCVQLRTSCHIVATVTSTYALHRLHHVSPPPLQPSGTYYRAALMPPRTIAANA
nr:unnamed protein product [Digitaria exilis]